MAFFYVAALEVTTCSDLGLRSTLCHHLRRAAEAAAATGAEAAEGAKAAAGKPRHWCPTQAAIQQRDADEGWIHGSELNLRNEVWGFWGCLASGLKALWVQRLNGLRV